LIDWLNPFSIAKAIIDLLTGQYSIDDTAEWANETFVTTTQYEGMINQPVEWRTNIRFTNKGKKEQEFVQEIVIPSYATNITVVDENGVIVNEEVQWSSSTKDDGNLLLKINEIIDAKETKSFFVHYTTLGPNLTETEVSPLQKRVVISSDIHYTNISAFATIDNRSRGAIHLYHVTNGSRKEVAFTAVDLDNDTLIDRIEWIVPHLSEQKYEVVIEIIKAEHLDKNRIFLADIYDDVKAKDGNWSETIHNDEYVRVTFGEPLDRTNDITIYARSQGDADIEVYTRDNDSIITTFTHISDEKWYGVLLSELPGKHTTFDLRTRGDPVQYDYLVDPSPETSVDAISPYIQSSSPLTITATNTTPANNVTLYYRHSSDNSSWDKGLTQDFNVTRGTCVIAAGATTETITNGTNYTLLTDKSHTFIRIVNARLTGAGPTSGGYDNNVEGGDYATRIDNPDNLDTSITFRRCTGDAVYDCRVTWELIQYVGASGGENEFIVRDVGDVTTASGQSIDGDSNITTIVDIDKVCCFITGQAADETTDADWFEFLFVAEMRENGGGGCTPWFWRAKTSATDAYVSYAVVEFVGSNWRDVQRLNISTEASTAWTTASPNEYTDVTLQSEGGIDLLDASKTFLHVQYATDNDATGLDDAGDNIEIISSTHLRIRNKAITGNRYKIAWIVENMYNGTGEMEVEHVQFYDSTVNGGTEERTWTQSISAIDSIWNTSIMGECASVDGTGTAYPRGAIDLRLTDVDEVTLTECDDGQERQITFDVVQWPCSINWNLYTNDTNPDENSPWNWSFEFPNGTGYYEFYSIGRISGENNETAPDIADARCYYNPLPTQHDEGPANSSTSINITPQLNVTVDDIDDETLTAYWISNSSGSWMVFGANNSIDTSSGAENIKQTNSNFSDWGATYWWSVNVTDDVSWSNVTYHFTTNFVSTINNPGPANQSSDLNTTPICNITVSSDVDGGTVNVSFYENTTGVWKLQQTNSSVDVTTPSNVIWNYYNNATSYSTTYWWKVNVTDDKGASIEATYHFTTSYPPSLSNPDPENETNSVPVSPVCSITASDNDGGNVTVKFYENTTGIWKLQQTNSSVNVTSPAIVIWNSYSNASAFNTKYWWKVNVTDSKGLSSEETYHFTTALGNPPLQSAENPPDASANIPTSLTTINVTIEEPDGESMDWTIETNPDIGNSSAFNEGNGSKTCTVSGMIYGITYTWYVNATDGTDWSNETYAFTTSFQPDVNNPEPSNESIGQNLTPQCNITVSDVIRR